MSGEPEYSYCWYHKDSVQKYSLCHSREKWPRSLDLDENTSMNYSNISLLNHSPHESPVSVYGGLSHMIDLDLVTEASKNFQRKLEQESPSPHQDNHQFLLHPDPYWSVASPFNNNQFGFHSYGHISDSLKNNNSRIPQVTLEFYSSDEHSACEDSEIMSLKEFLTANYRNGDDYEKRSGQSTGKKEHNPTYSGCSMLEMKAKSDLSLTSKE
ncbi:uncharacterized protein CANTADRAFT_263909 [Suhomyces tanzawaensis NRRL Y-17324]|uniref:Uncharacterized protein n=1 Tax=Suhomyces tanzawaensis NRRL Y-17324 TaxID=984487 RepID=A0A1E4SFY9_9ASCO|nr:uncharacterized protein CANTADRAFT_263909 [Suhomyces tanzawaensis NRRL Y-17324]ODV78322.1 hypothetical protein CANTADRAFT_263909 [Suhomyces tanzawaensis NRRL Y-17324]